MSLFRIHAAGESDSYELVHAGNSRLEMTRSDGTVIGGRFEADMHKVSDRTMTPLLGAPIVRVRGTFCVPAMPANPADTGP